MTDQMTTPRSIQDLVRVHHLLSMAEAEALAAAQALDPSGVRRPSSSAYLPLPRDVARFLMMADELSDLAVEVHLLFPAGVVPDVDGWPLEATGADPLELARQAEQLTRSHPIAEFPPGMGGVVARLIDTIRDFS